MTEASQHALAERVAQLESERAIVATLYAYGNALDYGDRGGFSRLLHLRCCVRGDDATRARG